jgi:thymidine kinase
MYLPNTFNPGMLEVSPGSMFSDKSYRLISRLKHAELLGIKHIAFKPEGDTRTPGKIYSRWGGGISIPAIEIPNEKPEEMLKYLDSILKTKEKCMIGVDETELFDQKIVEVVKYLRDYTVDRLYKINIVMVGLNSDFRGEPFGPMPQLMALADILVPLYAVCDYIIEDSCSDKERRCFRLATRTQRMINGEPAPYNDKLIKIDGDNTTLDKIVTYHARCPEHHFVPGKPDYKFR